ncbi:MAG: lipopolysaccharide core heptose(I) kinase RfaP [Candidatus Arsenophonus phytopathogenicus]
MLELKQPFKNLWQSKDPFIEIEKLDGKIFRQLETRKTLCFMLNEKSYFLKIHYGTTLKEVLKNLFSLRLPVLGADREWKAIHRLTEAGIDTMHGKAFGQKGINPLRRKSFIITEALIPTINLEEYCENWKNSAPQFSTKKILICRMAEIVLKMHACGANHRDCYICHFLLHLPFDGDDKKLKISIIDLHRAQIRQHVPKRWKDKDLIGLYFSSLNIGLTQRDIFRFMQIYFSDNLKNILNNEQKLISSANIKAERIKERTVRRGL